MSFDRSWVLFFLFFLVGALPALFLRYHKSLKKAALFAAASPSKERPYLLKELRLRMVFSDIFFILCISFLIIAISGPRWGSRIVADYRRGIDVVLAIDLSRSMEVEDSLASGEGSSRSMSRFDRGMEIARELSASLGDLRIGAAIGRGSGILAVPLTYDGELIQAFLMGLDREAISGTGTNLEDLIDAASRAFMDSFPSRRGIILFTDGEAHTGSFQRAVERARREGISLSAVGLGSEEGGPIPLHPGPGQEMGDPQGRLLLDQEGRIIISSRNANILRYGAERTGGIYVDGNRPDAALVLREYIDSLSAESRLTGHRRESNPRWRIFVIAAILCLGLMRLMAYSRRNPGGRSEEEAPSRQRSKAFLAGTLFMMIFFGSCTRTQGILLIMEGNFYNSRGFYTEAISSYLRALEHDAPYAEYGLASVFFSLEEGEAALDRYLAAERALSGLPIEDHEELLYRIRYNTGIIYFEQGDYDRAAQAFREALTINSSRLEAKRNLELSLITIAMEESHMTASPDGRAEGGPGGAAENSSVIFEYLREREQQQWRSREWTGESDPGGPDY
ncbi:MAG: tetratricopeptide repeat protein [Treponema sp.]|nr:tetratricopeptide repeat protein [Treponema sp.]